MALCFSFTSTNREFNGPTQNPTAPLSFATRGEGSATRVGMLSVCGRVWLSDALSNQPLIEEKRRSHTFSSKGKPHVSNDWGS